jgi:Xaa-Pro aminopeptidase
MKRAAQEIKSMLEEKGLANEPVGVDLVEPSMMFALQAEGLNVIDGQQILLEAREIKSQDELMLLNQAASMVDATYHQIYETMKPGVSEAQIVANANKLLYELGSDDVEAINAISGERCNPHPIILPIELLDRVTKHSLISYNHIWDIEHVIIEPLILAELQMNRMMLINNVENG